MKAVGLPRETVAMHDRSLEFSKPARNRSVPAVGALVRTARMRPDGIHRAVVTGIVVAGGVPHAVVSGRPWPFEALEVIRPPVHG